MYRIKTRIQPKPAWVVVCIGNEWKTHAKTQKEHPKQAVSANYFHFAAALNAAEGTLTIDGYSVTNLGFCP